MYSAQCAHDKQALECKASTVVLALAQCWSWVVGHLCDNIQPHVDENSKAMADQIMLCAREHGP